MKAPFPYPGGKSRVADLCWQAFDTGVPRYLDPFGGSLAVPLARPRWPDNAVEIVNDLDGMLVNAWRCIRLSPVETAAAIDDLGGGHELTLGAISRLIQRRRSQLTDELRDDMGAHDVALGAAWLHGQSSAITLDRPNPMPVLSPPSGVLKMSRRQALAPWLADLSARLRHVTIPSAVNLCDPSWLLPCRYPARPTVSRRKR
jgi:hypothetical protein